jgi:hypothetical protein
MKLNHEQITGRETTMKFRTITTIVGLMLVAGFAALSLSAGVASVSASERNRRHRELHATKECSQYTGAAGSFCTITSSNLPEIKVGSRVIYDQAAGIPAGVLDSNVVLDAGDGDRALGRCTLDFATGLGLCTFSDGTGRFTGFHARVDVSHLGGRDWAWDGTYSFRPERDRDRDR